MIGRFFQPLLLASCLLVASSIGSEEKSKVSPPQALPMGALPQNLTSMFPVGREFKGVSIPSYSEASLQSVMNAETIVRVDDQYLDLEELVIEIYNGADEVETTISMDAAAYDLVIGELTSKTPAKIEQPKFVMTGDKMIFDTRTQVSRLIGNVRVVVPDAGSFAAGAGFSIPGGN